MRSLMHARVDGEEPLLLSAPFVSTVGFQGDPSDLLCGQQNTSFQAPSSDAISRSYPCQFNIPTPLITHLKRQRSEVVQVLLGMDGALGSGPTLIAADPPISTSLVAMELSTPQGEPIHIKDLDLEQAIQVTLPNKYLVGQGDEGGDWRADEGRNGTCLTVTLPSEGQLNFTVKVDGLDGNAGLYLSLNFSLAPGTADQFLPVEDFKLNLSLYFTFSPYYVILL